MPPPATCEEWLAVDPTLLDGVFELTPAAGPPYKAYCDMGNGGFTLVLKVDGTKDTFHYDKPIWTDGNTLNPNDYGLDTKEAKLASFSAVPVGTLRLGMTDATVTRWLDVPLPMKSTSLQALLGGSVTTTLGNDGWKKLVAAGSIQTNCNWEGINVQGRLRIGLLGDESGNCATSPSPDSFLGFGGKTNSDGQAASGNWAHWDPDNGIKSTPTFGYVMVR